MTIITDFTGVYYPDMSFSIGRQPREKKRQADKEYDRTYFDQIDSYTEFERHYEGNKYTTVSFLDGRVSADCKFISSQKSSHTPRRYGQKGISAHGKKMIRSGAALLEKIYGRELLAMVTLSLPNFSDGNLKILSQNWNEVQRIFFQRFVRHLKRRNAPTEVVICTEIQEKRYRKYGQIAPHFHFIYVCRETKYDKNRYIHVNEMRQWWNDALISVLRKKGGNCYEQYEEKASVNANVIRKSAVGYIGKYMSKGGAIVREINENGRGDELPRQWWSATATMKALIESEKKHLDQEICEFIFDNLNDCMDAGLIVWGKYVQIVWNDKIINVGCVGKITEEQMNLLRNIVYGVSMAA